MRRGTLAAANLQHVAAAVAPPHWMLLVYAHAGNPMKHALKRVATSDLMQRQGRARNLGRLFPKSERHLVFAKPFDQVAPVDDELDRPTYAPVFKRQRLRLDLQDVVVRHGMKNIRGLPSASRLTRVRSRSCRQPLLVPCPRAKIPDGWTCDFCETWWLPTQNPTLLGRKRVNLDACMGGFGDTRCIATRCQCRRTHWKPKSTSRRKILSGNPLVDTLCV